tara:strand:+ start:362 stop:544 length:183 start_codon:yes stop_codon:yes gene_type:complete
MKTDLKDTIEFWGVNIGGLSISLTQLDAALRTLILIATLIYSIQKIRAYTTKNKNGNNIT